MQDRDASVKRLRAVAKSTADKASKEKAIAAAQPLEASQRAVIRDLSLRVANLTRINNQLKEERERAQVTLFFCDRDLWYRAFAITSARRTHEPSGSPFHQQSWQARWCKNVAGTINSRSCSMQREMILMTLMVKCARCVAFIISIS